jgi:methylamine utilization protein MauJ
MTRFLGNWEVETDIILPENVPFLRYDHPASIYTAFLRNIPGTRHDLTYLSMQFVFDAPSLLEAKRTGEQLAKEFLDYVCLASNLKARLRALLQIFNWEPGDSAMREALYFTKSQAHDDAPYSALQQPLLDTVALLQAHPVNPRLRRAMKWFANGVASKSPDDQFTFFWFVVELIAQIIKEPSRVPDKCPTCREPLYCPTCQTSPLHRPYPKQAIEQLFLKYCSNEPEIFYGRATEARNFLMHGDEVHSIEAALKIEFPNLVNEMGELAWISILNQFTPALVNKTPLFLQTNQYVYMNLSAKAHVQVGFAPNFENPAPSHFPNLNFTITSSPRRSDAGTATAGDAQ